MESLEERLRIALENEGADEIERLTDEVVELKERCAALESREVCTVAHDDVETCGYCQRDRIAHANREQAKEIGVLRANLDARRNIDRYVSFLLAGDETINPQDAADRVMTANREQAKDIQRLEDEIAEKERLMRLARKWIEKVGHTGNCPWRYPAPNAAGYRPKCTCGLDDLLAAITHDAT